MMSVVPLVPDLPPIGVGVCICYPISGGDGPVYVCHLGEADTKIATMTINWLTSETPATLPTLPCNVSLFLWRTFSDATPKQTWTITTASTTTKWALTKVSDSDSDPEEPFRYNIPALMSRQKPNRPKYGGAIVPGTCCFAISTPYYFQFAAFNAPMDDSLTITIANCPLPIATGTFFKLYLIADWNTIEAYVYVTEAANATGATAYLYFYSTGSSSRKLVAHEKVVAHENSKCSYCGVSPIIGVKYTCNECIDYHLCSNCEETNSEHDGHSVDHALLKIKVPVVVHEGVTCDDCGVSPIEGVRYKCTVCDNYDICDKCETKNEHPSTHVLIKAKQPLKEKETKKKYLQIKEEKKQKPKNKSELEKEKEVKVEVLSQRQERQQGQQGQGQGYQGPFAKQLKEIRNMGFNSQSTEVIISLLSSAVKDKKNQNDQGVQWVVNKLIEKSL